MCTNHIYKHGESVLLNRNYHRELLKYHPEFLESRCKVRWRPYGRVRVRNQSIKSEWWYVLLSLSLLVQDTKAQAPLDDDSRSNSIPTIDNTKKWWMAQCFRSLHLLAGHVPYNHAGMRFVYYTCFMFHSNNK